MDTDISNDFGVRLNGEAVEEKTRAAILNCFPKQDELLPVPIHLVLSNDFGL
jgi:hypothetical protein